MSFSPRRVWSMFMRYFYLLRGSPIRLVELAYWPTVQMILWGFVGRYFAGSSDTAIHVAGAFIGAVLLWDFLFRSQLGVSLTFMEELWSRNLGHLFISPLRPAEWFLSMMLVSAVRAIFGLAVAAILAWFFFGFSILSLGLPFIVFFLNLMVMGWWLGLMITAMLMRAGLGAEGLCWATTFLLAPVSAIYYPVSVLPPALQVIAKCLPTSYVFEGMREILHNESVRFDYMLTATCLNIFYILIGAALLNWSFQYSRKTGNLFQTGE